MAGRDMGEDPGGNHDEKPSILEKFATPDTEETRYCRRGEVENRTQAWAWAVAPLFVHLVLTIAIAIFMFRFVDGNNFNLTSRRPSVTQPNGSITHYDRFDPLQSDITTALSSMLVVLRLVAGMWTAATVWRCVFALMEKAGLPLQDINWMISYGLPVGHKDRWNRTVILVAIVLLAAFPSQFSSPILTGSITWKPSSNNMTGSVGGISLSADGTTWSDYRVYPEDVEAMRLAAAAAADVAWGGIQSDPTTMKRVLSSTQHLPINSTLKNVTVPYFAVTAIEWIKDPEATLTQQQKDALTTGGSDTPYFAAGPIMALIPDGAWGLSSNATFPSPSLVSETRILVAMHSHALPPCTRLGYFGLLPENIGIRALTSGSNVNCLVYARITYEAGAAVCEACRHSAQTVVQNSTALVLQADVMTGESLTIMPRLMTYMSFGNYSVPPIYNNINNYSVELLSRSYGAAWTVLTNSFASPSGLATEVTIPVPMSQASVLSWRVYVWLVLNLLLTFSGLLFIFLQRDCDTPMVADIAMATFLLDTSHILHSDQRALCDLSKLSKEDSEIGLLRLVKGENGHRFVTTKRA